MRIKVLRDYSGAEGTDADQNVFAGDEHIVTRARAAELHAVGLVEIVGEDEHPDDAEAAAEPAAETAEKARQRPKNKAAAQPENKAG